MSNAIDNRNKKARLPHTVVSNDGVRAPCVPPTDRRFEETVALLRAEREQRPKVSSKEIREARELGRA